MIRGIKFASIPVRDQKEAVKFYTEKLGFKIITDQESEIELMQLWLKQHGAQR